MKRALVFLFVAVLLGVLIGGLSYFQFVLKPKAIKDFITTMKQPPSAVSVAQAGTDTWPRLVRAIGTFRPVQGIDIAPQVGGIVQALRFDSAQEVTKGTVLVDIDSSTEQADLASGLAQMKNADLSLSRQKELISGGNTSRATVDAAQATRDMAAASVDRAKAIIAQKTIAAPFTGRLGIRKVDVGQYVSPGTALVTLTQLDPLYVDFTVPEQSLSLIRPGQAATIGVDGFPEDFKGTIKSLDSRVSQDSRSITIRAEVANHDKRLLPGMFADVAVVTGEQRDIVVVPKTAVSFSLYGDSVYVVRPASAAPASSAPPAAGAAQAAGATQAAEAKPAPITTPLDPKADLVVERRFVRTGQAQGDRIAVTDGLTAGETIVTEGQIKLMPGAHVTLAPGGGMAPRSPLPLQ